ncbi:MAG: hypothetical protein K6F32_07395 [Bacilli bacterium]|nr:hypothetical protein [Bacilli bacterium]
MGKRRLLPLYISACCLSVTALAVGVSMAFYVKNAKGDGSYGEIGLRSYFESGLGTSGQPYIITRPRHLYNLSRLQSLGVFAEKTYFKLGFESNDPSERLCYADDSSFEKVPYLDMGDSNYSHNPIYAIGSESVPFYGEFDGQGLEIKHLDVYADPEDAGLFGYTAHGSLVHDLYLDDITINTLGYTDAYSELYGDGTLDDGVRFDYDSDSDGTVDSSFNSSSSNTIFLPLSGTISEGVFSLDDPQTIPSVSAYTPNSSEYRYSSYISGNLVKEVDGIIQPDLEEISSFFQSKRTDSSQSFPINASTSASIYAYLIDSNGMEHTKVLLTLVFTFSLDSVYATSVKMETQVGNAHGNNIGLLIGHCDGTIRDCYVHDGSFNMNDGATITGVAHNSMENGSNLGLIGRVGNTVQNKSSQEAGAATGSGKDIGVLDFTTVYNDIIDEDSFASSDSDPVLAGGVSYEPKSSSDYTTKYITHLRKNLRDESEGGPQYVTLAKETVSFSGSQIISNSDLGVFTIATDTIVGNGSEASANLDKSVVRYEENTPNYLYYATGEYSAESGINFARYRDSFASDSPSAILLGHHLPDPMQTTVDSFKYREWAHNFYFRFALQPNYRSGSGNFYFQDVDMNSRGGNYLGKYFNFKLVDQSGQPISNDDNRCGVMLRDSSGLEIGGFYASFATPDLSHGSIIQNESYWPKMYYLGDQTSPTADRNPAANMVNFEIKTAYANVTVVAANIEPDKPSALGVYRIEDSDYIEKFSDHYIDNDFDDPDYAFFMPDDEHLAYYDYRVNAGVGEIGNYDSSGNFTVANSITSQSSMPKEDGFGTEYGYTSGDTRLFVHTFKLPQGHYCLGSATGDKRATGISQTDGESGSGFGAAKIYYVCAQGQDDGQLSFDDNAFTGNDVVENIDFLKAAKYSDLGVDNDPERCYVLLSNSDRSQFASTPSPSLIRFVYADAKFKVLTEDPSGVLRVVITNYGRTKDLTNVNISVADTDGTVLVEGTGDTVVYAYTS